MTTRRWLVAALVGPLALIATSSTVAAQTSGGGELGHDSVARRVRDLGAGRFPGVGLPSSPPSVVSPYEWSRDATGATCAVLPGPVPPELVDAVTPLPGILDFQGLPIILGSLVGAAPGALRVERGTVLPPGSSPGGEFVIDVATPRSSTHLLVVPRCARPGEPLPPEPPTAADIWERTPLPRATVHASPPGTRAWPGIVHLETRFWGAAPGDAQAQVTLDGYAVSVVAHPIAYAWEFGDGTTTVLPAAASAATPTRAEYRRRGDYDVVLYTVWAGLADTSAPAWGLDFGDQDLGTVTIAETVTYHTAEIRSLLRSRAVGR